jgi:hypothetical protein
VQVWSPPDAQKICPAESSLPCQILVSVRERSVIKTSSVTAKITPMDTRVEGGGLFLLLLILLWSRKRRIRQEESRKGKELVILLSNGKRRIRQKESTNERRKWDAVQDAISLR